MRGEDSHGLKFSKRLRERPEIVVQTSEIYPFRILPGSREMVVVGCERIAKTAEDLEATAWKGVMLMAGEICQRTKSFASMR